MEERVVRAFTAGISGVFCFGINRFCGGAVQARLSGRDFSSTSVARREDNEQG